MGIIHAMLIFHSFHGDGGYMLEIHTHTFARNRRIRLKRNLSSSLKKRKWNRIRTLNQVNKYSLVFALCVHYIRGNFSYFFTFFEWRRMHAWILLKRKKKHCGEPGIMWTPDQLTNPQHDKFNVPTGAHNLQ